MLGSKFLFPAVSEVGPPIVVAASNASLELVIKSFCNSCEPTWILIFLSCNAKAVSFASALARTPANVSPKSVVVFAGTKEKLLLPTSILGVGKASPRIADVPTAGLILCADIPPASALGTTNLFATMLPSA